MNILYVVNADIENPASGTEQRTRLIYDVLCTLGNVYILDVRPKGESWRGRKFLRLFPQTGLKRIVNALWSIVVIRPCKKCLVPSYPFALPWSIEECFPGVKFDITVARYLYYVGLLELWNVAPKLYVDIDDYPMQIFETLYAPNYGLIRKFVSRALNKMLVRFVLRKTTGCWIANTEQVSVIAQICRCILLNNIPYLINNDNNINIQKNAETCKELFIFTVGVMNYAPNYHGVDIFLKNVWLQVNKMLPNVKYKIVGKGIPKELQDSWAKIPNVDILGFVEDLSDLYCDCVATVIPVLEGSGTCIKTLESLSNSRVCISTSFGARGIPDEIIKDGLNGIFIYNSSSEFINILANLINNVEWRKKCEANGKRYIDINYSKKQFESKVMELLK